MSCRPTDKHKTRIQSFYKDKVILLTGSTGFLGKCVTEKLLRSCPDVQRIYLLMREKKGKTAEDRLRILLNSQVFARLRIEQPTFSEKVTLIHGDLRKPNLGISEPEKDFLIKNVNIVLHCAAVVKFNEKLSYALQTNVIGTKQICLLATQITNLKAFVYVSTAYTNCEKDVITENICPPPISGETLINLADTLDEQLLDSIADSLMGGKPNTYIFTKSAAEDIVYSYKSSLPIAVLRPAIVSAAMSEPAPGWVDNPQAATGVVAAVSAGLMHTVEGRAQCQANLVPVDKVANAIIALSFVIATQTWQCQDELPLVNYVPNNFNCPTWGFFIDSLKKYVYRYPSRKLMWYPFLTTPQYRWTIELHKVLLHYVPATIIDLATTIFGYPTKLRGFYRALDSYAGVISYFSSRQFHFENKNMDILHELLDTKDQEMFPFSLTNMDWDEYMRIYVDGCRKFLLKEDEDSLNKARFRVKVLYTMHVIVQGVFMFAVLKLSWPILKLLIHNHWLGCRLLNM